MPVIGLTGGIGSGKTSFCSQLARLLPEATFYNADVAVRELTAHDPEVKSAIIQQFGTVAFAETGHLNREWLRTKIFGDAHERKHLEAILHPKVRAQWAAAAANARASNTLFVADIPLLYETNGAILCDSVVVVGSTPATQLARLIHSRRLTPALASQIIASQVPITEKMNRADHLVWNNGSLANLQAQAELIAHFWQSR